MAQYVCMKAVWVVFLFLLISVIAGTLALLYFLNKGDEVKTVAQVSPESIFEYDPEWFEQRLKGVLDGTVIEEPFEIKDIGGNVLATNRLAVNLFYNDAEGDLKSKMIPAIIDVNGETMSVDGMYEAVMDEWGYTEEEAFDFYKSKVIKGRFVKIGFITSRENSENYEAKLINPTERDRKIQVIIRQYLEGREENSANFIETGEMSEEIILSHLLGGSSFYGEDPVIEEFKK